MGNEMTVTMSMQEYKRKEKLLETYNKIFKDLINSLLVNKEEKRIVFQKDKLLEILKELEPSFNDYFVDVC